MNLAAGFTLCVLCASLTLGAQIMQVSKGPCGGFIPNGGLQRAGCSNAAFENADLPNRMDIQKQLDQTESALSAMKRPLNANEQKTAVQIRMNITHAREALKYGDIDGARTLSTKAHLLLFELIREEHPQSREKGRLVLLD